MDFQVEILKFFQSIRIPILSYIFLIFTISTELPVLILFTAIMYWCVNKKYGQRILFVLTGNLTVNTGVKEFVKAPRPIGTEGLTSLRVSTATGYSFPSGHTQSATAFWVALIRIFKNKFIYILGTIMIVGVGVSRLYLAVHWPIDVIFGWIFGITFTIILDRMFLYVDETKEYKLFIMLLIPCYIAMFFLGSTSYTKILGVISGFLIGYIVEDKYIKFNTLKSYKSHKINFGSSNYKIQNRSKTSICILRFLVGIVTLGIVYFVLKVIKSAVISTTLVGENSIISIIIDWLRYFIVVFHAVAGVPLIFKALKLDL